MASPRFTLSKLFTPWAPVAQAPARQGWYRTRTEPLTHSWWNGMAYFDGQAWWEFGTLMGKLSVRREVKVLQWQGLNQPVAQAIALVKANMPKSPAARRSYGAFLAQLGA